jgi:hypothetical protein
MTLGMAFQLVIILELLLTTNMFIVMDFQQAMFVQLELEQSMIFGLAFGQTISIGVTLQ